MHSYATRVPEEKELEYFLPQVGLDPGTDECAGGFFGRQFIVTNHSERPPKQLPQQGADEADMALGYSGQAIPGN